MTTKGKAGDGALTALFSLREIARRLDLPSSTVAYYKDRYRRYIPSSAGVGRRQRYSPSVLEIFRRIREMYDMNSSASEIDRDLELRFGRVAVPGPRTGKQPDSVSKLLERVSGLLDDQILYRREIDSLRDELSGLRKELTRREAAHEQGARAMETELAVLREENSRLSLYVEKHIRQGNPLHSKPSEAFLDLPLVIRSGRGEYLGVAAPSKGAFTPKGLVSLIQKSASAARTVDMGWDRDQDHWILKVLTTDPGTGREQALVFMLLETRTPHGNLVARLAYLIVDGNEVPDDYLLGFFKQLRDTFNS